MAGNSDYIVMGGEFPKVNGVAQQGLTRMAVTALAPNKRGPSYTTNPDRPVPPTTATSFAAGTARVGFGTAWDYDNESLTYDVLRDNGGHPGLHHPDQVELLDPAHRRASSTPGSRRVDAHLPGQDHRPVRQPAVEPEEQSGDDQLRLAEPVRPGRRRRRRGALLAAG